MEIACVLFAVHLQTAFYTAVTQSGAAASHAAGQLTLAVTQCSISSIGTGEWYGQYGYPFFKKGLRI